MTKNTYYSYRRDYNPTDTVKSYHHCNTCQKSWYAADNNLGFLICPYCDKYTSISVRLDITDGHMGLPIFDGAKYGTKPSNIQQATTPKRKQTLPELNRVLRFTGIQ